MIRQTCRSPWVQRKKFGKVLRLWLSLYEYHPHRAAVRCWTVWVCGITNSFHSAGTDSVATIDGTLWKAIVGTQMMIKKRDWLGRWVPNFHDIPIRSIGIDSLALHS